MDVSLFGVDYGVDIRENVVPILFNGDHASASPTNQTNINASLPSLYSHACQYFAAYLPQVTSRSKIEILPTHHLCHAAHQIQRTPYKKPTRASRKWAKGPFPKFFARNIFRLKRSRRWRSSGAREKKLKKSTKFCRLGIYSNMWECIATHAWKCLTT